MVDLYVAVFLLAVGSLVGAVLYEQFDAIKERLEAWRKGPPRKWQVRFLDPDGIPARTEELSAKGAGRLMQDIDKGYYA